MAEDASDKPKLYRVRFSRGVSPEDNVEIRVWAPCPEDAIRGAQVADWPTGTAEEVPLAVQRIENLKELGLVLLFVALGAALVLGLLIAPHLAAHYLHWSVGAASALLALGIWRFLGPKPQPGLLEGFICIMGYLLLFMNFVLILILRI